jgi:hypothetical protein
VNNKLNLIDYLSELIESGHTTWKDLGWRESAQCIKLYLTDYVSHEELIEEVAMAISEGGDNLSEDFPIDCVEGVRRIMQNIVENKEDYKKYSENHREEPTALEVSEYYRPCEYSEVKHYEDRRGV